jgi:hypothetical protein
LPHDIYSNVQEVPVRCANHELATLMETAGLRPPQIVTAVNEILGAGYLSRSTVSEWLHAGRVPREPLPAIMAQLLSDRTGTDVSVHDLWPHPGLAPAWSLPADHGLAEILKAANPAEAMATDWIRFANPRTGSDRRQFYPVPDSAFAKLGGVSSATSTATTAWWENIAQLVATNLAKSPPDPAIGHFAYRQVLVFAAAVLENSENRAITTGLATVTSAAERVARAERLPGLAQRYAAAAAIFSV